jgi:hypothetical protein
VMTDASSEMPNSMPWYGAIRFYQQSGLLSLNTYGFLKKSRRGSGSWYSAMTVLSVVLNGMTAGELGFRAAGVPLSFFRRTCHLTVATGLRV